MPRKKFRFPLTLFSNHSTAVWALARLGGHPCALQRYNGYASLRTLVAIVPDCLDAMLNRKHNCKSSPKHHCQNAYWLVPKQGCYTSDGMSWCACEPEVHGSYPDANQRKFLTDVTGWNESISAGATISRTLQNGANKLGDYRLLAVQMIISTWKPSSSCQHGVAEDMEQPLLQHIEKLLCQGVWARCCAYLSRTELNLYIKELDTYRYWWMTVWCWWRRYCKAFKLYLKPIDSSEAMLNWNCP